jgi:hypothetical protein
MARWSWDEFQDNNPGFAKFINEIRHWLPPLNFITIHYAYFIVVCLASSLVFWGSSNPALSISYADSLFLVVSAMTEAGLNTVNLSQMTTWQQTILFLLIILGSSIWVSIWTVIFRKHAFEKRFDDIVKANRVRRLRRASISPAGLPLFRRLSLAFKSKPKTRASIMDLDQSPASNAKATNGAAPAARQSPDDTDAAPAPSPELDAKAESAHSQSPKEAAVYDRQPGSSAGHIAFADEKRPNGASTSASTGQQLDGEMTRRNGALNAREAEKSGPRPPFLTKRTVSRNSQFHDLSSEEREQLGGHEYRALKILSVVVPLYFFLWQLLGCLALGAWVSYNMHDIAVASGINPWWLGIFNAASAFNNSGMSVLDANMVPFQNAYYMLITMGLLILAGNTAYPIFLRMILSSGLKLLNLLSDENEHMEIKATFEFILKYPRRVYTNLFPSRQTWWLLFMLILLNGVDWAAFELLNFGNPVIEAIPRGSRVLDGLFQALGEP